MIQLLGYSLVLPMMLVCASALHAGDSLALSVNDSASASQPPADGSRVLAAVGNAFKSTALDAVERRAVVGEAFLRAGLDRVTLPPRAQMRENIDAWGARALGPQRWGSVAARWDAGEPQRRQQFIREHGTLGALGFLGRTRNPQPASYYWDMAVRPGIQRWWRGVRR